MTALWKALPVELQEPIVAGILPAMIPHIPHDPSAFIRFVCSLTDILSAAACLQTISKQVQAVETDIEVLKNRFELHGAGPPFRKGWRNYKFNQRAKWRVIRRLEWRWAENTLSTLRSALGFVEERLGPLADPRSAEIMRITIGS